MKAFFRIASFLLCVLVLPGRGQTSAGLAEVRIRGDVRCIQPMADGSFVLGGFTAYYNGTRDSRLLRVKPDGSRVAFPVEVGGSVSALALNGAWLYIGGDFQTVNGVSVPFAARVNAATGAVDPGWRPAPNGDLINIVPVAGGVVLNGSFSRIGGLPRNRLALIAEAGAGRPVEGWRCDANNQVDCVKLINGWLYAGGRFNNIGGLAQSWLARLNPDSGAVDTAWRPSPNNPVFDIAADGTHLYLAGGFTRIGSVELAFLGRLPLDATAPDATWAPQPDSLVARVCVSGDSVYAAGNFVRISTISRKFLARLVKATGNADSAWNPPVDGALLAMVPDGANGCWGGGRFDSNGTGSGFARFLSDQGTTPPAYPGTVENAGVVKVIKPDPATGGWLVGGDFDTVNGTKRHALFRLQASGALDTAWSAALGGYYTEVTSMDLSGTNLLIGGQFETAGIGGELIYNCLMLTASTGAVIPTFKPLPTSTVQTILPAGGTTWFVGGNFERIGTRAAPYLARIGGTGQADPSFLPKPNGPVHALLQLNNELYAGGEFSGFAIGSGVLPLPYLARLTNNAPDPAWQPRPNQAVFALAAEGNFLYAGGRFTGMARGKRRYLAQLPLGGAGAPTAWNPAPDNEVRALRVSGAHLYAGGSFFGIASHQWPKLARFTLGSLALDMDFRTTGEDGGVFAIEPQTGGTLLAGGNFTGWDDDPAKRSLVRISPGGNPAPPPARLMQPPADGGEELLADYFHPDGMPVPKAGRQLMWDEQPGLPKGMVARVQWSTDLQHWRESGDTADGVQRTIVVQATGTGRRAEVISEPPDGGPLFLRVMVTAGENPPAQLRP